MSSSSKLRPSFSSWAIRVVCPYRLWLVMGVSLVVWVGGVVIGDGVGALGLGWVLLCWCLLGLEGWGWLVWPVVFGLWVVLGGLAGFGLVVGLVVLVR